MEVMKVRERGKDPVRFGSVFNRVGAGGLLTYHGWELFFFLKGRKVACFLCGR